MRLVREYYKDRGSPPSVRYIARRLRVSTRTIYREFPGGVQEIYRLAGISEKREVPELLAEFMELYAVYGEKRGYTLGSLEEFISGTKAFLESRLGPWAVERLTKLPLSSFNKIARMYLEKLGVEGGEEGEAG